MFIIALFLVVSITGLVLNSKLSSNNFEEERLQQCHFISDAKHSFAISGTSISSISAKRFINDEQSNLLGTDVLKGNQNYKLKMYWQISDSKLNNTWTVKTEISDFTMDANLDGKSANESIVISHPFLMDIKDDCSFNNFRFHESSNQKYNKILMSLLLSLEVVLPADRASEAWKAQRVDALGLNISNYKVLKPDSGEQHIKRNKLEYLHVFDQPKDKKVTVKVIKSVLNANLDSNGHWVKSIDGTEHNRLAIEGSVFSESLATFHVLAIPADFFEIIIENPHKYKGLKPGEKLQTKRIAFANTRLPTFIYSYTTPEILNQFQSILSSKTEARLSTALELLTLYLRENKASAMEVIRLIETGEIGKSSESLVFLALQLAGTKESESALILVCESSSFSLMNQSQAIHALSQVSNISQAGVDMIFDASKGSLAGGNEELANISLLALGALGLSNKVDHPDINDRVVSEIKSRFNNADTFSEKALVLATISNTDDERFMEEIKIGLEDESVRLRELSLEATAKIKSEEVNKILEEVFMHDTSSDVRIAALSILANNDITGISNERVIKVAAGRLSIESANKAKTRIINYLGANAEGSTIAKDRLVAQYHNETDPNILILIGQYVSATDLQ
jgi:hypothetical protein